VFDVGLLMVKVIYVIIGKEHGIKEMIHCVHRKSEIMVQNVIVQILCVDVIIWDHVI
jgi:hypothetical protein